MDRSTKKDLKAKYRAQKGGVKGAVRVLRGIPDGMSRPATPEERRAINAICNALNA